MLVVYSLQFFGEKEVSGQKKKHVSEMVAFIARKTLFCEQWKGSLCKRAGCSGHPRQTAHHLHSHVRDCLYKPARSTSSLTTPRRERFALKCLEAALSLPYRQYPKVLWYFSPGKCPNSSGNWEVLCKFVVSEVWVTQAMLCLRASCFPAQRIEKAIY